MSGGRVHSELSRVSTPKHSMAFPSLVTSALLLVLLLTNARFSTCNATKRLKGSVTCLDCSPHYHLSGVKITILCNHMKNMVSSTTLTNKKGHFEAEIPSTTPSSKCFAKLLGGPVQLCAYKRNMVSEISMNVQGLTKSYKLSTPLAFFITSCSSRVKDMVNEKLADTDEGSSPPAEDPQPTPWGLAPPSYFYRFLPIIGIP